ncbi:MAG TPA: hypothetical protein VH797_06370 [Nitrososphaeraceae archaeon]|jgi:hypothetical protein
MSKALLFAIALLATISATTVTTTTNYAYAEKCKDIKGTEKWDSEGHGENKPSSKEFKKMLNDDSVTICELAESIDHMNVKGEVKDWSDFKDTTVYMSTTEKVQNCLKDRMHLGDSLADYEIQKCATGDY